MIPQLKQMFLQNEIKKNQAFKAYEFDMQRVMQEQEIRMQIESQQAMQKHEAMKKLMRLDNLDTPAARELYQVKQLLASRERPQLNEPGEDLNMSINRILLSKLI